MRRILAAVSTVVVAIALAALPSVASSADQPDGGPVPCDQIGYTKFNSSSGSETLYSNGVEVGTLVWSGTTLTYTLNEGWSVDLCVKSGSQVGTEEHLGVTGTGSITIAQDISHIGWKNPVLDEPDPEIVTPNAFPVDQTCYADQLQDGHLVVDLSVPGVTYAIDGGTIPFDGTGTTGSLPPGDYLVTATDSDPNDLYELAAPYSVTLTIAPYDGECGYDTEPEIVTPAVQVVHETCVADELVGGHIVVDLSVPGVTYEIEGGTVPFDGTGATGELTPGDYLVTATDTDPNDGYELAGPFSETVTVEGYEGECGENPEPEIVTPSVTVVDQVCEAEQLVDGHIVVDVTVPGVTYEIDGGTIPFDAGTGATGSLPPGDYLVTATDSDPNDLYELAGPFSETVSIAADDSDCFELPEHPIVEPFATAVLDLCSATGASFTIGNDLGAGAVFWTLNGAPIAPEGTYPVTVPSTITLVATANAPDFGFAEGTQTEWTFQFTAPPGGCDLTTLALTGSDQTPALGIAALFGIVGAALLGIAWGRRQHEEV